MRVSVDDQSGRILLLYWPLLIDLSFPTPFREERKASVCY